MHKFVMALGLILSPLVAQGAEMSNGANNFYKSDEVTVQKVTFKNQYQMNVAGNLFVPKNLNRDTKHPAIVVGHPMGADHSGLMGDTERDEHVDGLRHRRPVTRRPHDDTDDGGCFGHG